LLYTAIRDIWQAFKEFTDQAILFAFFATIIYLIISLVTFFVRSVGNKRPHSIGYVFAKTCLFALFGIYISYLYALTLSGREEGSRVGLINLVPFKAMNQSGTFIVTEFENIVLFVPLGLLIPFVWKYFRGIIRTSLTGFVISLSIEVIQLVTSRGFFDVDDVIFNTMGTVVGYSLFAGLYDGFLGIKRRLITDALKKSHDTPPLGKLYERFPLRHGMALFLLQGFPVFLWINIIMGFSSDNGDESGALSKAILLKILKLFGKAGLGEDTGISQSEKFLLMERILRRCAHLFEYALLAFLVWACIYSIRQISSVFSYGMGLFAAFIVGMMDERNQMGVVGRTGTYRDVLWDMTGALFAICLIFIILQSLTRYYRRKHT